MNKTAVITGGTKGIGRSLIIDFALEGFDIITNSRKHAELLELQAEVEGKTGVKIDVFEADFSDKQAVISFAEFVNKKFDYINVLINNAGVFIPGGTLTEAEGVFETEMAVNLEAPYYLTRKLIELIRNSKDGYIFNICSTASITAYSNGGSYCISKFGLLGFTKVLRQELKSERIAVSAVMPGATMTNSWAGTTLPITNFMQPEDISQFVLTAWKQRKNTVLEEIILRPYPGDL